MFEILQAIWFFGPAYAADVSPIFARELLPRLGAPIDGGRSLGGRPLLGSHKTWRGLIAGVVAGILVWEAQVALYEAGVFRELAPFDYTGRHFLPGFLMGLGAGVGDAVKSFFKRRVGIEAGSTWVPFDQIDFFVGSLAFAAPVWMPRAGILPVVCAIVFVCDVAATTVFWWLGLKESWI